jgi:hypothetical protein
MNDEREDSDAAKGYSDDNRDGQTAARRRRPLFRQRGAGADRGWEAAQLVEQRADGLLDATMVDKVPHALFETLLDPTELRAYAAACDDGGRPVRADAQEHSEDGTARRQIPGSEDGIGELLDGRICALPTQKNIHVDPQKLGDLRDGRVDFIPSMTVEDGPVVREVPDRGWHAGRGGTGGDPKRAGNYKTKRIREQCSHVTISLPARTRSAVLALTRILHPPHVPCWMATTGLESVARRASYCARR